MCDTKLDLATKEEWPNPFLTALTCRKIATHWSDSESEASDVLEIFI